MSPKESPSFSEVKVGMFVLIALIVLALGIFAIGTRVGLFAETFWAMTYLSNVSGLKPGDIVLLGGVEVGNVHNVEISPAGTLPETAENQRLLQNIEALNDRLEQLRQDLAEAEQRRDQAQIAYDEAVLESGPQSSLAERKRRELRSAEIPVEQMRDNVEELQAEINDKRAQLQNIRVLMQIDSAYRSWLRADSNISLGSIGLLGDKFIEISLGRSDIPPATIDRKMDSWLGKDTVEVVLITGTQQASFEELITGANDIMANFQTLSQKMQDIMSKFDRGEGTMGLLFNDPALYENMNQTAIHANEATQKAAQMMEELTFGEGTMARLVQERELYDRIAAVTERLERTMTRIDQGDGTLGKFVNDPSFYRSADQMMANVAQITRRMDSGQGTLGKLSTDDQLYIDLRRTADKMAVFLEGIQGGKGTLGKLANDEKLYNNLNEVSAEVVKLLYDFRQDPKKFLTIKFELF